MYETYEILPGITLRCVSVRRFKQGCLSIQLLRPMCRQEAALNALLPAILLRGCREYPDLQQITQKLDDLYGASVGTLVRRIGDYQSTGFYCGFIEDRFALPGDEVLTPMLKFAFDLLLDPVTEQGCFSSEYVESEKRNLISAIESELADKRAYAASQLLKIMGREDSFGVPRLGEAEDVAAITAESAYRHYRKILEESPMELFYVGSAEPAQVAGLLTELLRPLKRNCRPLPPQTPFHAAQPQDAEQVMDVAQGKLNMGFITPITNRDPRFAAMQVLNTVLGSGMTSKLFMQVREKMSLCYAIGSGYYGSKGLLTVSAGIDFDKKQAVWEEIMRQLDACREGRITESELTAARESILSSLRSVYDSPASIEGFASTGAISGLNRTPESYADEIRAVTAQDVAQAARTLTYHSTFFLKGGAQ